MDIVEQKISTLETVVEEIKNAVNRIEVGLFGDEKMNYIGLIQKAKDQSEEIETLTKRISDVEEVNRQQELIISAKKSFVDTFVIWAKRVVWGGAAIIVIALILSGKLGIGDLIKMLR